MNPHFFIAIPLPNEVRHVIYEWTQLLKTKWDFASWVHPEDYHITLAFLGSASFKDVQMIKKQLKAVIQQHHSFQLTVTEIGTFGRNDSPRVLWADVEESKSLRTLREDVYAACEEIGFTLDKRPFHPHITLARKWRGVDPFPFENKSTFLKPKAQLSSWSVKESILYQTHLDRLPKYQPLTVFTLR